MQLDKQTLYKTLKKYRPLTKRQILDDQLKKSANFQTCICILKYFSNKFKTARKADNNLLGSDPFNFEPYKYNQKRMRFSREKKNIDAYWTRSSEREESHAFTIYNAILNWPEIKSFMISLLFYLAFISNANTGDNIFKFRFRPKSFSKTKINYLKVILACIKG